MAVVSIMVLSILSLKDVAERTGLDISTISRVSNVKYAQTKWGTFPLKFFFTDSYTTAAATSTSNDDEGLDDLLAELESL